MAAAIAGTSLPAEEAIQRILAAAREHFGMDVAFVSEFVDDRRVFRYVDCDGNAAVAVGDSDPLEDSYCQRILDGRLPAVITDTQQIAEAAALAATRELPVGSHLSVPLRLRDGSLYGTFCCFSSSPNAALTARDGAVMHLLAGLVADYLGAEAVEDLVAEVLDSTKVRDAELQRLQWVGWPAIGIIVLSAVLFGTEVLVGRRMPLLVEQVLAVTSMIAVVVLVVVTARWRHVSDRLVRASRYRDEHEAITRAAVAEALSNRQRVVELLSTRGAVQMVFQPIYDLRDGSLVGHEALARFGGDRRPDEAFADAHAQGLGVELEFLALTEAIKTFDCPTGYLAVNLSPAALRSPALQEFIGQSPDADRLVLELTEHDMVEDYEVIAANIARLRERGTRLAVDDAGSGFASMRHITDLGPEIVKLDRSIIDHLDTDPGRKALVASLVQFASQMGATVVAEGIERPEELAACRATGVSCGQGYLLGRPATPAGDGTPHPLVSFPGRATG